MASIAYTGDDGSVVQFVDPAGVTAAIEAAITALPAAPTQTVDVTPGESVEVVAEAASTDAAPSTEASTTE